MYPCLQEGLYHRSFSVPPVSLRLDIWCQEVTFDGEASFHCSLSVRQVQYEQECFDNSFGSDFWGRTMTEWKELSSRLCQPLTIRSIIIRVYVCVAQFMTLLIRVITLLLWLYVWYVFVQDHVDTCGCDHTALVTVSLFVEHGN